MSQIDHRKRLAQAAQYDPTFVPTGGRRPAPRVPQPEPFVEPVTPLPQLAPGAAEILAQVARGGTQVDEGDGFDLKMAGHHTRKEWIDAEDADKNPTE